MKESYRRWMHDWETRMTSRDNNRVVRPFEWGNEFVHRWPVVSEMQPPVDPNDSASNLAFWTAVNERAVDVQINRLRRKIERDPASPLFLQAVRGIGYRLVASP